MNLCTYCTYYLNRLNSDVGVASPSTATATVGGIIIALALARLKLACNIITEIKYTGFRIYVPRCEQAKIDHKSEMTF